MIPQLWTRDLEWNEWRLMHPDLNDQDAEYLYSIELKMFQNYQEELINQYQLRQSKLTGDILNLSADITTIINQGSSVWEGPADPKTFTYNTPGTYNITIPDVSARSPAYNQVTIEAVGGGGQGQIGSRVYTSGQISYYVGGGGGGGAYAKRSVSISSTTTISVTVGGGSTSSDNDGGDSSFTISGTTTTAGGGGTSSRNLGNYPMYGSAPIHEAVLAGGTGGTVTGPSDISTNGSDGTGGKGQANISDVTNWPIGSSYASIRDRGRGGASGWPTSTYVNPALFTFNSVFHPEEGVAAQSGNIPGGGGGGGIVTGGQQPNGIQGNGADGRVIVKFGYA